MIWEKCEKYTHSNTACHHMGTGQHEPVYGTAIVAMSWHCKPSGISRIHTSVLDLENSIPYMEHSSFSLWKMIVT